MEINDVMPYGRALTAAFSDRVWPSTSSAGQLSSTSSRVCQNPLAKMPAKAQRSGEFIETDNGNKVSRRAQLHATQHIVLAGKSVIQHDVIIRGDLVRQQPQPPVSQPNLDASSSKTVSSAQNVSIHLGRYVFISSGCTLHPPSRLSSSDSSTSSSSSNLTRTSNPNVAVTSTSQDLAARRASAMAPPVSPLSQPPEFPSVYAGPAPKPSSQSQSGQNDTNPQAQRTLTHYPLRISSHVYLGPSTYCAAASIGSHVFIGARCVVGNMVIIKDCVRIEDDTVLPPATVWRSGVVVKGKPGRVVGEIGEGWTNGGGAEGGGGGGGGGGMETWGRELWASVGNHVKRSDGR